MSQLVPNISPLYELDLDSTMYSWSGYDFKDTIKDYQFNSYGVPSIPSRTTPTLTSVTPTTLRNLDPAFFDCQADVESHQNEAGFEPPVVQTSTVTTSVPSTGHDNMANSSVFMSIVDPKNWHGGTTTIAEMPMLMNNDSQSPPIPTPVLSMSSSSSSSSSTSSGSRKNIGGRRPNKENGISPEEEERRRLRRERNKIAAARCRKRRMDKTNELEIETSDLENKRQRLLDDIKNLENMKQELQFVLENHSNCCIDRDTDSPQDIKPYIMDTMLSEQAENNVKTINMANNCDLKVFTSLGIPTNGVNKSTIPRQRPNSLPVTNMFAPNGKLASDAAGVPITTPSGVLLNFDSLMNGGTGLTPIASSYVPSCSSQQRNSNVVDLSSPDSIPTKLVSL